MTTEKIERTTENSMTTRILETTTEKQETTSKTSMNASTKKLEVSAITSSIELIEFNTTSIEDSKIVTQLNSTFQPTASFSTVSYLNKSDEIQAEKIPQTSTTSITSAIQLMWYIF